MTKAPETPDAECQDAQPNYPTLTIDWDLYASMLEDSDLSEDEQREFIETLWNIVVSFVDLGFGIHPMQRACEQNDELSSLIAQNVLSSNQSNTTIESNADARDDYSAGPPTDSK